MAGRRSDWSNWPIRLIRSGFQNIGNNISFLFENSQIYSMEKFTEQVTGYWNFLTFYLLMSWIWRVGNDDILFRENYKSG